MSNIFDILKMTILSASLSGCATVYTGIVGSVVIPIEECKTRNSLEERCLLPIIVPMSAFGGVLIGIYSGFRADCYLLNNHHYPQKYKFFESDTWDSLLWDNKDVEYQVSQEVAPQNFLGVKDFEFIIDEE